MYNYFLGDIIYNKNKFDHLLTFLISLQVFGIIGDAFQPIRVFVLLLIPFTLIHFFQNKFDYKKFWYEFLFFLFWIFYAILSLIWVNDIFNGLKEITYLCTNFFTLLAILFLSRNAINPKIAIIRGWVIVAIISLPYALFEIFFDIHLPVSTLESGSLIGGTDLIQKYASFTFGNYNGYNVRLLYILPFFLSLLFLNKSTKKSILISIIILLIFFILISNGSRGALVCIFIYLLIFIFSIKKLKVNHFSLIIILLTPLIALVYFFDQIFFLITLRLNSRGFEDDERSEIALNCFKLLKKYNYLGVGSGNYLNAMNANFNLEISATHNLFLEVLTSYGLIIFFLFFVLLFRIIIKIYKTRNSINRFILLNFCVAFPFLTLIDSGYLLDSSIWIVISSLIVFSDNSYKNIIT